MSICNSQLKSQKITEIPQNWLAHVYGSKNTGVQVKRVKIESNTPRPAAGWGGGRRHTDDAFWQKGYTGGLFDESVKSLSDHFFVLVDEETHRRFSFLYLEGS